MKDKSISYARKRIEKQIEIAERERKRRLQAQRLELARAGINAYQRRKLTEAVKNFHMYLHILEEIKDVDEGGLLPSHFDLKKDSSELLMISGVYWDLAKLYDRTRSNEKRREFLHYLQKYVAFSSGMPYQHLCAEAIRKYLSSEGPVHKDDFRNAYKVLTVNQCFVASALVDVLAEPTIPILRNFRDRTLVNSASGRHFIRVYYRWGPKAADQVVRLPLVFRQGLGIFFDLLAYGLKRFRIS